MDDERIRILADAILVLYEELDYLAPPDELVDLQADLQGGIEVENVSDVVMERLQNGMVSSRITVQRELQ